MHLLHNLHGTFLKRHVISRCWCRIEDQGHEVRRAIVCWPGTWCSCSLWTRYQGTRKGRCGLRLFASWSFWNFDTNSFTAVLSIISTLYINLVLAVFFLDDHVPTVKGREKCRVHRIKQAKSIHSIWIVVLYRNQVISEQALFQRSYIFPQELVYCTEIIVFPRKPSSKDRRSSPR